MISVRDDWTASPTAVANFAHYCAPTTLAALMGCSPREAAAALLPIAVPTSLGGVNTTRWITFLETLGGKVEHIPGEWVGFKLRTPTVAQFLRANPHGTFVILVRGHTLLAREGEVVADTKPSKSMRSRVFTIVAFEAGT